MALYIKAILLKFYVLSEYSRRHVSEKQEVSVNGKPYISRPTHAGLR